MSETVGFIGLGHMGEGMARRLLSHGGRKLIVWNRSAGKSKALETEQAGKVQVAASPADVVKGATIIFVMLSTPDAVKEVYEMEGGILSGMSAGKKIVDCATLAVADMERVSSQVLAKGGRFIEAPVSGSKVPAATGQLIFLCGGDEALYGEVAKDLDAMGKAKFFFGAVGAGTKVKLAVKTVKTVKEAGIASVKAVLVKAADTDLSGTAMVEVHMAQQELNDRTVRKTLMEAMVEPRFVTKATHNTGQSQAAQGDSSSHLNMTFS